MTTQFRRAAAAAAVLLAACAVAAPASAQHNPWRSGRVTIENDAGGVTTIDRDVYGRPGARYGESVVTGPNGRTYHRQFERNWDPATQTFNRRSTLTGPNGYSRTVEGSTRRVGPGAWENRRTVTGPYGGVRRTGRSIRRY